MLQRYFLRAVRLFLPPAGQHLLPINTLIGASIFASQPFIHRLWWRTRRGSTDPGNKIGSSPGKASARLKEVEPKHDWSSLSHACWECKYNVVIVPMYRKKRLYGKFRVRVGTILRELCRQKGGDLMDGHLMATTSTGVRAFRQSTASRLSLVF